MKIRSFFLGCLTAFAASGFSLGTLAAEKYDSPPLAIDGLDERISVRAKIGSPGMYQAIVPCRIVDTRRIPDFAFSNRMSRLFDVTGVVGASYYGDQGGDGCDIPTDGTVSAVTLSITAIDSFGTGYIRVWPSHFSEPNATIMNYPDHRGNFNMSTNAIVPIGPIAGPDPEGNNGELWLKNYGANPQIVIDVTGYFSVSAPVVDGFVACTDPRPEFCTQNIDPVCGQLSGGSSRTYDNACKACADPAVSGHVPGACPL